MILFFRMLAFVPFNHLELENGNSCFHTAKSLLFFFASHSNTQSSEAWKRLVKQKLDQAGHCKRVIIPYSCALSELFMVHRRTCPINWLSFTKWNDNENQTPVKKKYVVFTESVFLVNQPNLAVLAAASVSSQVEMQSLHKQVQKFIRSLFRSLLFNHYISSRSFFYPPTCPPLLYHL